MRRFLVTSGCLLLCASGAAFGTHGSFRRQLQKTSPKREPVQTNERPQVTRLWSLPNEVRRRTMQSDARSIASSDRHMQRIAMQRRTTQPDGRSVASSDQCKRRRDIQRRIGFSSAAVGMFPIIGRLFSQASQLFQVGVLMGPLPTVLAAGVTAYWAFQTLVAGSRGYQSRVTAEGIKSCRVLASKVGPGSPGFVDRNPILDANTLRAEVESRYNPTLLVHGERGSGKTSAVRLALHAQTSVVHVKLWAQDLDSPLKALGRVITEAAGADVPAGSAMLVAEQALRRLKDKGWTGGAGNGAPIVVVELDKRCTSGQLLGVLLACKRWGDDENLVKYVVEAPSGRIARGLPISLADLRVEGVKVHPLTPQESLQVARGSVPVAARREWGGARPDDLARYVTDRVGFGMLDVVRAGFASRAAQDPIAFRSAVDALAAREARVARSGVMAFLRELDPGGKHEHLERKLWEAIEGAAAIVSGAKGRNPGLDEVLEKLGVSEREFERAAGGVGPVCPVAVDPFSYKVAVRSKFYRDAMSSAARVGREAEEEFQHAQAQVPLAAAQQ